MLEITRVAMTDDLVKYALSGEITVDQAERIKALIHSAAGQNRRVELDLRQVWRFERDVAFLIAPVTGRPSSEVRVVAAPAGLLEWLRADVAGPQEPTSSRRERAGGDVWKP